MRSRMVVGLAVVLLAGCGSSETVLFDEEFALPLEGRRLELKVSAGKHRVSVRRAGYRGGPTISHCFHKLTLIPRRAALVQRLCASHYHK